MEQTVVNYIPEELTKSVRLHMVLHKNKRKM